MTVGTYTVRPNAEFGTVRIDPSDGTWILSAARWFVAVEGYGHRVHSGIVSLDRLRRYVRSLRAFGFRRA